MAHAISGIRRVTDFDGVGLCGMPIGCLLMLAHLGFVARRYVLGEPLEPEDILAAELMTGGKLTEVLLRFASQFDPVALGHSDRFRVTDRRRQRGIRMGADHRKRTAISGTLDHVARCRPAGATAADQRAAVDLWHLYRAVAVRNGAGADPGAGRARGRHRSGALRDDRDLQPDARLDHPARWRFAGGHFDGFQGPDWGAGTPTSAVPACARDRFVDRHISTCAFNVAPYSSELAKPLQFRRY